MTFDIIEILRFLKEIQEIYYMKDLIILFYSDTLYSEHDVTIKYLQYLNLDFLNLINN